MMKAKSDTAGLVMSFFRMIETQFEKKIKCFRSDNGESFSAINSHNF